MNDIPPPPSGQRQTATQRRLLTAAAGIGVAVLAGVSFVLSYDDLRALALEGGAPRRYGPLYPVMVDALVVITITAILMARQARWWARWVRWSLLLLLIAGATAASVQRAVEGYASLPDRWVSAGVAAAPWVLLLIAVWLWLSMFKHARAALVRPATQSATPEVLPAPEAPVVLQVPVVPQTSSTPAVSEAPVVPQSSATPAVPQAPAVPEAPAIATAPEPDDGDRAESIEPAMPGGRVPATAAPNAPLDLFTDVVEPTFPANVENEGADEEYVPPAERPEDPDAGLDDGASLPTRSETPQATIARRSPVEMSHEGATGTPKPTRPHNAQNSAEPYVDADPTDTATGDADPVAIEIDQVDTDNPAPTESVPAEPIDADSWSAEVARQAQRWAADAADRIGGSEAEEQRRETIDSPPSSRFRSSPMPPRD